MDHGFQWHFSLFLNTVLEYLFHEACLALGRNNPFSRVTLLLSQNLFSRSATFQVNDFNQNMCIVKLINPVNYIFKKLKTGISFTSAPEIIFSNNQYCGFHIPI